MGWVIDRFEQAYAVLERLDAKEETVLVPREALPAHARENDVLRYADGAYTVDSEATAARAARLRVRFEQLKAKRP